MLLGHFGPIGAHWGSFGVELFFVLSGRLMAQILFEKRVALPTFFWRRFSRIYPALLVYVAALAAGTVAASIANIDEGIDALSGVAALTFTINYFPAIGATVEGPLDHLWSIAVEEHCYAILALIALVIQRSPKRAMIICLIVGAAAMLNGVRLYLQGAGHVHEIYWRTDVRLAPVFISAGLYLLSRRMPPSPKWLAVALAITSVPVFHFTEILPLRMILPTLMLAYAVNSIDFTYDRCKMILSARWLTALGLISYSLYLWQQPFYKVGKGEPLFILPAIILAIGSYHVIEKPCRRWLNEIPDRKRRN